MTTAREAEDRLTKAIENRDLAAVGECYTPDAEMVTPEGTFHGRDQIQGFFRGWIEPFSDTHVSVENKVDTGDTAVDEWSFSGRHSGPMEGPGGQTIAPTGRQVTVHGADVVTVRGGLIAEQHAYYDQVEMLGQLGLLPG